jgi:DNA topoisomerase-1
VKRLIRTLQPTDGGRPVELLEGRYGPYVTDGETNASIPQGMDPSALSLEEARGLIEARQGAAPRPRRRKAGRTGARSSAKARTTAETASPDDLALVGAAAGGGAGKRSAVKAGRKPKSAGKTFR